MIRVPNLFFTQHLIVGAVFEEKLGEHLARLEMQVEDRKNEFLLRSATHVPGVDVNDLHIAERAVLRATVVEQIRFLNQMNLPTGGEVMDGQVTGVHRHDLNDGTE